MTDVALEITEVHRDARMDARLRSGKYRVNQELNEEWIDLQNSGPYVLNLQGRVLACVRRRGLISHPDGYECLRFAQLRAHAPIALHPEQRVRIFTGEQPFTATQLTGDQRISRVLWLVQPTYLWVSEGNEAHLYLSLADLRNGRPPLARRQL